MVLSKKQPTFKRLAHSIAHLSNSQGATIWKSTSINMPRHIQFGANRWFVVNWSNSTLQWAFGHSNTEEFRIFSVPVFPLVTRLEYSQSLSSHWSHVQNILSPYQPIGHTFSGVSVGMLLLDAGLQLSASKVPAVSTDIKMRVLFKTIYSKIATSSLVPLVNKIAGSLIRSLD